MGAFQSGFQQGGELANQAIRNAMYQRELALKEAADKRAAEEFGWRRDAQRREDEGFTNYTNLAGGVNTGNQAQIRDTYGMTPQQIASGLQNGGATGLQAKLASYDTPDSFDLQSVPAAGVQPGRFDASQLKAVEPSRLDRERGLEQLAVARRDIKGIRESQTAQRGIQIDDITANVMKKPIKDIESMAGDLNMSGYPLLYTGKTKDGYTFLKTENDGKTPIAGSSFKLNEAQFRQLALAHELGAAGFGTEAMTSLTNAHKDIGDHVSKWNTAMSHVATSGNQAATGQETARHNREDERLKGVHYGIMGDYYKSRGAMDRMGAAQYFQGQDGNTYAAIPTMGKGGLTFQTVQVNDPGIKLSKMGGTGLKPVDVKEEGTKVMLGDRLMYADGMGGYVPASPTGQPMGYLPSQRPGVLKQHGIPDNLQGRLQWSSDGTGIRLGSREYDPRSSDDMKALVKDANDYDVMQKRIDESMRTRMNPPRPGGLAFGPKITYPNVDPNMPGLYAGEEEWARYRASQNGR